jgi:hypothetical protein
LTLLVPDMALKQIAETVHPSGVCERAINRVTFPPLLRVFATVDPLGSLLCAYPVRVSPPPTARCALGQAFLGRVETFRELVVGVTAGAFV